MHIRTLVALFESKLAGQETLEPSTSARMFGEPLQSLSILCGTDIPPQVESRCQGKAHSRPPVLSALFPCLCNSFF